MTKVIVDASVVVKWYFQEDETDLEQSVNLLTDKLQTISYC